MVTLTGSGQTALARARCFVVPPVEAAVRELPGEVPADLLEGLAALEQRLDARPSSARVAGRPPRITIQDFSDALAPHFRSINAEWIEVMDRLEQTDIDLLDNPRVRIIDPGRAILFAEAPGLGIIGTCALQKPARNATS